jgi:endonuclease/exonuclease/phosphatase (EEP) superfamily protein YafD
MAWLRALILVSLILIFASCHHATRTSRPPLRGEPTLTVMTFNVNFALAGDAQTLRAIADYPADLVFLQETNRAWQAHAQAPLSALYPHQVWHHEPAAGGQAILSKRPFTVRQVLPSPTGWFPALHVAAETPLGDVEVLAVHLHPPITETGSWVAGYFTTDGLRLREIAKYIAALDQQKPTLIVGDFNEGTRDLAMTFLESRGFRTTLPEFSPDAKTWHWPFGKLELSAQFDHLVYDPALEPLDAAVMQVGRSDHFPVRGSFVRAQGDVVRPAAPSGSSLSIGTTRLGS